VANRAANSGVVESYRTNKAINEAQEDEDDDEDENWYGVEESLPHQATLICLSR
jgi:hypothetical protein